MKKKDDVKKPLKLTLYVSPQDFLRSMLNGMNLEIKPSAWVTTTYWGSAVSPVKNIGHGASRKPSGRKK